MSDIKKTALVILIIALLSNTFTQYAYASNEPIDYNAMMQYEGYGKAMYDSVVEQTTFITGQYTNNKDYVRGSMDQIKSYADFWYNEYNDFTSSCYQSSAMNCLGEMVERGGGYVLTVGDWIKNLFSDYDVSENGDVPEYDFSNWENYFVRESTGSIYVKQGYIVTVHYPGGTRDLTMGTYLNYSMSGQYSSADDSSAYYTFSVAGRTTKGRTDVTSGEYRAIESLIKSREGTVSGRINNVYYMGATLSVKKENGEEIINDSSTIIRNPSARVINEYIQDPSNSFQIPVPKIMPVLVCSDGERINLQVSGSNFINSDGSVLQIAHDGTATIGDVSCNLDWLKPRTDYVDDKPIVTNPDGTVTDLETGETNKLPPSSDDLEGCEGVLCGIGKLLDGLGSVVSSITGMIKSLLDGLVGLFVPKDLAFMTEEFNKITNKLNDKIAITDSLKEAITGVFDGGDSNPLANISINLPITNEPLSFGNVSFIEEGVPILRKVISAIVVLYTIAYVYRKITGRGGVMER